MKHMKENETDEKGAKNLEIYVQLNQRKVIKLMQNTLQTVMQ